MHTCGPAHAAALLLRLEVTSELLKQALNPVGLIDVEVWEVSPCLARLHRLRRCALRSWCHPSFRTSAADSSNNTCRAAPRAASLVCLGELELIVSYLTSAPTVH